MWLTLSLSLTHLPKLNNEFSDVNSKYVKVKPYRMFMKIHQHPDRPYGDYSYYFDGKRVVPGRTIGELGLQDDGTVLAFLN